MKAVFTPTCSCCLCLAFLRVDPGALRRHFVRPWLVLAAVAWMMIVTPLAGLRVCGRSVSTRARPASWWRSSFRRSRPPVIARPAFAALLGLDAALSLATLVACAAARRSPPPCSRALSKVPGEISAARARVSCLLCSPARARRRARAPAAGQPGSTARPSAIEG